MRLHRALALGAMLSCASAAAVAVASPRPSRKAPKAHSDAAQDMLEEHNRARSQHCAPALSWSTKLAAVAQRWANHLRDSGCSFGHSDTDYGENLAAGTSGHLPPATVVGMWVDEKKAYDYARGAFSMKTGHFTQVVWRETTEVGCGMSQCRGNDIWVCNYSPPGNVQGAFKRNVLPESCKKEK